MTEQVGFDGQSIAVADGDAVEMLVLQRAEEPLDYAVGPWVPHQVSAYERSFAQRSWRTPIFSR
ncbi:hypothetical protein [Streptomyces acidicola]|uniref:hypothetical protein n=1 Tax=Streptomyces acidicola TaxID=2596892 RepID=UPI003823AD5E